MGHTAERPADSVGDPLAAIVEELILTRQAIAALQARETRLLAQALDVAVERVDAARGSGLSRRAGSDLPVREVCAELATAMRLSDRTVQARMGDAAAMVATLPATLDAWEAGRIDAAHAAAILDASALIDGDERRARFETIVLEAAGHESPARLRATATAVAASIDPQAAANARESAHDRRCVRVTDLGDGLARLVADLPLVLARAILDRLTQQARAVREGTPADVDRDGRGDAGEKDDTDRLDAPGRGAAGSGAAGSRAAGRPASGTGAAGSSFVGPGAAGSGIAGSGIAGTGIAGTGTADTGTADTGTAGTGTAGTGTAGTGTAGTGTAGTGTAGTGAAGTGTAGTGAAGSDGGGDSPDCVTSPPAAFPPAGREEAGAAGDVAATADGSDTRTMDQLRADILSDLLLAGGPVAHGDAVAAIAGHVQVTIPAATLLGASDEPALLAGHGPIDADTARQLAAQAPGCDRLFTDPFSGAVLAVDRYRWNRDLERFLRARDEHCRFPGCRRAARRCDVDHTVDAAHGGPTSHDNLAHLCRRHHTLKHATAWSVRQRPGGILEWRSPLGRSYRDRPPSTVRFVPTQPANTRDGAAAGPADPPPF